MNSSSYVAYRLGIVRAVSCLNVKRISAGVASTDATHNVNAEDTAYRLTRHLFVDDVASAVGSYGFVCMNQDDERIYVGPRFDGWESFVVKLATRTRDHGRGHLPVTSLPPTKHKDSKHMNILALDLGKPNTTCCVLDTKTRKTRFLTTPTQRESHSAILKQNKADLVVMESCGPSGWIDDLAKSLGRSTLVCSTDE